MYIMKNIFTVIIAAASIISCSSSSNNSSSTDANATTQLPNGPVSYKMISGIFSAPPNKNMQQKSLLSGGGCGTVMSNTSSGLAVASGFASLVPSVGPMLGVIIGASGTVLSLAGGASASSCIALQFDELNQQLALQEDQLQNIQSALNLNSNEVWAQMTSSSASTLSTNYNLFNNSYSNIIGYEGLTSKTMITAGFWNADTFQPVMGYNIESLFENQSAYANLIDYLISSNINSDIQNLAGIKISGVNHGSLNNLDNYISINVNPSSDLMNLYSSLYIAFKSQMVSELQIQIANNQPTSNLVPYLDQYNETLIALYQEAAYGLMQSYQIAYLINQINYLNYVNKNNLQPLPNITYLEYAYYYPSSTTCTTGSESDVLACQTNAYNQTQTSLSMDFSILINQLYLNTLSYIITDVPSENQSYPDNSSFYALESGQYVATGESINYTAYVGKNVTTATQFLMSVMQDSSPIYGQNLIISLQNASASWTYQPFYYQYSGLQNAAYIESNLIQYNTTTLSNPNLQTFINNLPTNPQIFIIGESTNVNQSIVSWDTIQPYAPSAQSTPYLIGAVENNVSACNGTSLPELSAYNFYYYTPNGANPTLGQIGTPYLMCGNWSTNGLPSNQQVITNEPNAYNYLQTLMTNTDWEGGTLFVYTTNANVSNMAVPYQGNTYPETAYLGDGGVSYGNYPITGNPITVLSANQTNWGNAINTNENITYGSSYSQIFAGWMKTNYASVSNGEGVSNIAAIQITLPDGFIVPLGLVYTNIAGYYGTYAGISVNPNLANVTIDGAPILNTGSIVFNANNWGHAANNLVSYSKAPAASAGNVYANGFYINGNLIFMNGTSSVYYNQFVTYPNVPIAYILVNPDLSLCPNQQTLDNNPNISYYQGLNNFICTPMVAP